MRHRKEISKDNYSKIEELAEKGVPVKSIAAYFGMGKSTFDRRVSENDELKLVLEKGRSKSIEAVASVAYEMALSGNYPAMTMFWLKCRAQWRENAPPEATEDSRVNITFVKAS
jgi:hypothetical protein